MQNVTSRGFLQKLSSFARWRRQRDVTHNAFETRKSMLCEAMVAPATRCLQAVQTRAWRNEQNSPLARAAVIAEILQQRRTATCISPSARPRPHRAESAHTPRALGPGGWVGGWVRRACIEPRGYVRRPSCGRAGRRPRRTFNAVA